MALTTLTSDVCKHDMLCLTLQECVLRRAEAGERVIKPAAPAAARVTVLANITGAAADLLTEALIMDRYGVGLGGIWDTDVARELEAEGLGRVLADCRDHGMVRVCPDRCDAGAVMVFRIGQAGANWLVDAGRTTD